MAFLSDEEDKDFQNWAFGYIIENPTLKVVDDWNRLHGDELWVRPDEVIADSLENMYGLYVVKSKPLKKKAQSRKKKIKEKPEENT